ncbi:pre-mRNA cleavage complex 2 protein Pcf11, partial [Asbolus verrucosus]
VDEETRAEMFKLRQTWNNIFPQKKLYAIDVQISMLDPAWPVTAQPPSNSIHFNPKFLKPTKNKTEMTSIVPEAAASNLDMETFTMQQKLIQKQKELIELQQKKLKLELLQTQVKLQKQLENNPQTITTNNLPVRTQFSNDSYSVSSILISSVKRCQKILFKEKMNHNGSAKRKNHQPIKVYVRQRPFNDNEIETHSPNIVCHMTNQELVIKSGLHERRYNFDQVFGAETSQKEIYNSVVCPLISSIMAGYNCTVFAYGQTGTGKTYTMIGGKIGTSEEASFGLIPRSAAHLFDELGRINSKIEHTVRVSFIEIYNEEVRDLLSDSTVQLKIFENPENKGSICLKGLKEATVFSLQEVYDWLNVGLIERQTASTIMNHQSSRSHSIFTLTVLTRQLTVDGDELIKTGKLYLVDLAGSENVGRSGSIEIRAREAGTINRSLLTLGKVIKALAQKAQHVPYRDSKLTRILQDSLGGRTKTCMIATISPAANVWEETVSTLDYAQVARNVSNCPQVNENRKQANILKELKDEIGRLRKELAVARSGEGFYMSKEHYEKLCSDLEKTQSETTENRKKLTELIKTNQMLELENDAKERQLQNLSKCCDDVKRELNEKNLKSKRNEYILHYLDQREAELKMTADQLWNVCEVSTKHEALFCKKYETQCEATFNNAVAAKNAYSVYSDSLKILQSATQGYNETQKGSFGEIHINISDLKEINCKMSQRLSECSLKIQESFKTDKLKIDEDDLYCTWEKYIGSLLGSCYFGAQKKALEDLERYNKTKIHEMEVMATRSINTIKQLLNDYVLCVNDIMKNQASLIETTKNIAENEEINWGKTVDNYRDNSIEFIRNLVKNVSDEITHHKKETNKTSKNLTQEIDAIKDHFLTDSEDKVNNVITSLETAENSQISYENVIKKVGDQTLERIRKELDENIQFVTHAGDTPNILLKPEVAKQLMPEVGKQLIPAASRDAKSKPALGVGSRIQQTTPRITPVNSALVATATRPTRDPRLLRQQTEKASNGTTSSSTSVSLGSKTAILDSNNKIVTNTKSVRDSRVEPRLVNNNNNKDNAPSSLNKLDKSKTSLKSRQSEQKPSKPSRSKSNADADTKSLLVKSTVNLLDLPVKSKGDKSETRSPTKSLSRHKKKDHNAADKKSFKESKRDRENKSHKNECPPTAFKGVKNSAKNRNYIRRNRSPSYSPEPNQDIDLRLTGPPEKQARLQGDSTDEKSKVTNPPGMDVDLRQLNDVPKKRTSSDNLEHTVSKKSKSEVFDALFGNEDTDLRTVLPVAQPERPPTPPPPIISLAEKEKEKEPPKKSSDFDAKRLQEDEDLRVPPASPRSANDSMKKIIISSDDEQCIKAGTMTKEQEKNLMNKIIAQIEQQKLKEAQLKDKEESVGNLQPVSDEELDFSEETDGKFGDKDDRVNFHKFSRDPRDSRRGGTYWRGGNKRRHWENPHSGPHPRPGIRPWMHPMNAWRPIGPNFNRPVHNEFNDYGSQEVDGKKSPEVPVVDLVVDSVNQDDIKTINIDGVPRDIRYYDETAIVFMNWDDPREISFQNGNRRVVFDDKDIYFLPFNEAYQELSISGTLHKVRLGAPSREIFINGKPYECYFGGPGITIDLNGQMTVVKLDGPPPQVKIGTVKRMDLVAGKVNLIIDAKILVPVFLDAKVQKFVIDGETHTLKFVDALKTVLINDVPFKVEFGGLPKPITVHDKKHFIRFSVLPRGVKPGVICIKDMEGGQIAETDESQDGSAFANIDINEPALPVFSRKKKVEDEPDRNSNSPHFFQNFMQQNNLDVLSSVMTSSITPIASSGGYQVENLIPNPDTQNSQSMDSLPYLNPVPVLPASLNINELFQKLVATGIVATKEPMEAPQPNPHVKTTKRNALEHLKPITFNKPETLKVRQNLLYEALYSGMQCSSCGMRFPPEQSMHYSQHLDWHFRQNRKGKKNIRVAASRKWYYSLSDWKNYEEIEDLEEREKNYFDQQQSQAEGAGEDGDEEIEIPSVPADPDVQDAHCEVCQDKFDHFFNEDKEEWHLKNAIRVDDKTYHPVCYEDYQTSLLEPMDESREESNQEEIKEKTEDQNIPGLEIILDDDDEEEQEHQDEEVLIEESDDSKQSQEEPKAEESETKQDNEDDDDVIINEVVPEKIEVDDDKEYTDSIPSDLPVKVEQIDDGFMDVEEGLMKIKSGGQIKIKSEPLDPDELPPVPVSEQSAPFTETTQPGFISSIDGNSEPISSIPTTTASIGSKIRINISKPLPVITPREPKDVPCDNVPSLEPVIDPSQPLPPGEEPIQLNIKPALRGLELKKLPPVQKGSELTGIYLSKPKPNPPVGTAPNLLKSKYQSKCELDFGIFSCNFS